MTATATPFSADSPRPAIDYAGLGDRLRAYRIGAGLQADDVAAQLGVSRAVVYRMEKGEIVKIDTLERLAALLGTSMASLLGVETEYYASALALFERMRQLEEKSDRILAHFEPISLLLTSDAYLGHLGQMLYEGLPATLLADEATLRRREIARMLEVLQERRRDFALRKPQIVSLVGLRELERFVLTGLVGRVDLPAAVRPARAGGVRRGAAHGRPDGQRALAGAGGSGGRRHAVRHLPAAAGAAAPCAAAQPVPPGGAAQCAQRHCHGHHLARSRALARKHDPNPVERRLQGPRRGPSAAPLVARMATALPSPPATAYPDTP
jgi:transcriptional regulator with XRE-family HTH domain